jgi:predicted extracellular nuclease
MLLCLPLAGMAMGCGEPATPISRVQGQSAHSPLTGHTVTAEGILTLDTRGKGGFGGFYLQQADHETDNNPLTSEALFVYTRQTTGKPGDRLRVTGKVKEYHGLTELVSTRPIIHCGESTLPRPVPLSLPWPQPPEAYENMRVRITQPLTVIDNYNLARYGELTLAAGDQVKATEYQTPSETARTITRQNRKQRIILDDGKAARHPDPTPWPPGGFSPEHSVRAGDTVHSLTGILDFRFDHWRIQPDATPRFSPDNARRPPPARPAGSNIRVVSMNLENYFNGDGSHQAAGFPTARGAKTLADYNEQHHRLVDALTAPGPDILALSEVENDGYGRSSALVSLARALGQNWQFVATPGKDGQDAIRTALLYRRDRLKTVGPPHRLTSGPFQYRGRPPLAQTFQRKNGGDTLRVVALHLKSKSCRGATGSDADQHQGEGCFARRRTDMASAIITWLKTLPDAESLAGTLMTGDFNSYAREAPLTAFQGAGFTNMMQHFHPCHPDSCPHYSYRYKGEKGSLDHALASGSLTPRVLDTRTWLINSDEPRALGYEHHHETPGPFPWRSSDHNPLIIDLHL